MILSKEKLRDLLINPKLDESKKNFYCKCPWCGHNEFGIQIYKDNHPFNCFRKRRCGETGNIYKFLKKIGKSVPTSDDSISKTFQSLETLKEVVEKKELPKVKLPVGYRRVFYNEYLEKRGFVNYNKYEVGITKLDRKFKNYVIFPIKVKGEIKGYVSRSILSKQEIDRYKALYGKRILRYRNSITEFNQILYGIEEITSSTNTVILVEGIFGEVFGPQVIGVYFSTLDELRVSRMHGWDDPPEMEG